MATVRLLHSIYTTDPKTGEQKQIARQGQTARIDRDCFGREEEPVARTLLANWRKGVQIRLDGADEPIEVQCWNLEPAL